MVNSSLSDIQVGAVNALRAYDRAPEGDRTRHLREVAELFVDGREHFFTREGEPDYKGSTYAYRTWVRETMTLANVAGSEVAAIQAAIRYHVSNVLRERLAPEKLQDLGLRVESARQRSTEKRERQAAVLGLFSGGPQLDDADSILGAADSIAFALSRIDPTAIRSMPAARRREVGSALESVATAAQSLVDAAAAKRR